MDVALKSAAFVGPKIRRHWIDVKDKTERCIQALFGGLLKVMHTTENSIVLHRLQISWTLQSVSMIKSKVADTWEETQACWQHRRTNISKVKDRLNAPRPGFTSLLAHFSSSHQLVSVWMYSSRRVWSKFHQFNSFITKKKDSNRGNPISIPRPVKDLQHGRHWEPSVQETLAIWWRKGLGKGSPCDMVGDSSSPSTSTWLSRDLNTSPLMGSPHTG